MERTEALRLLGADTDFILHDVLGLISAEIGRLHGGGIFADREGDPAQAGDGLGGEHVVT